MRHIKIFSLVVIALILALAGTLPASPAWAVPSLFTDQKSAKVSEFINAYGLGFSSTTSYEIYFSSDGAPVSAYLGAQVLSYYKVKSVTSDNTGAFNAYFPIPVELTGGTVTKRVRSGTYYIYATLYGNSQIQAVVLFTVERSGDITIDPVKGKVGTEIKINGAGYATADPLSITYDDSDTKIDVKSGDKAARANGDFVSNIVLPRVTAGLHTLVVTGDVSGTRAKADFIVEPGVTLNPASAVVGDTVTVTGTGFGRGTGFTVSLSNVVVVSGQTINLDGSFEASFTIPSQNVGNYVVDVVDDNNNAAKANLVITPTTIILSPASGNSGSTITVTGAGYQNNKPVSISFNNDFVKSAVADQNGKLSTTFTVPLGVAGTYSVKASDGANRAEANFTIIASASLSQVTSAASPGYVGSDITVNGAGFTIGKTVTVTYDGNQVTTVPVSATGNFSATFKAPASRGGNHTIIMTDGVLTKETTFVMESAAPPTPRPLKPEMGLRTNREPQFDWEDVSDRSGVTYSLQIATREDFAAESIVIDKTGLTASEYTITKEELLKSLPEKAPYYWHVKAVDSALNESGWSGVGTFFVGSALAISQQVMIYVLIGVGVLALAFLGFWLGRRSVFY